MVEGYKMIDSVKAVIESTGEDDTEFDAHYEKANTMADIAGIGTFEQTFHRSTIYRVAYYYSKLLPIT
jgi:hypothetical protein